MAPLHCAAEKDYVETMALIIAYAGNIDMRNKVKVLYYKKKKKKKKIGQTDGQTG